MLRILRGAVSQTAPVWEFEGEDSDEDPLETVICMECHEGDHEEELLMCDGEFIKSCSGKYSIVVVLNPVLG